jgi:hypothetical protein
MKILLVAAIAGLFALGASAQVHKCVDAKGKISYSETPCGAAERGGQVLGKDATALRSEEEQLYQAQRNRDSLSRTLQQQQEMIHGAPPPADEDVVPAPVRRAGVARQPLPAVETEPCETYSTRQGCIGGARASNPNWSPRKGYYGGGGPADQAREQQERQRANAPPGQMVNCDTAGCWGSANGVRYNRVAGGNLSGANGSFCTRAGNTFNCN